MHFYVFDIWYKSRFVGWHGVCSVFRLLVVFVYFPMLWSIFGIFSPFLVVFVDVFAFLDVFVWPCVLFFVCPSMMLMLVVHRVVVCICLLAFFGVLWFLLCLYTRFFGDFPHAALCKAIDFPFLRYG